jgi:hypothetical protein
MVVAAAPEEEDIAAEVEEEVAIVGDMPKRQ